MKLSPVLSVAIVLWHTASFGQTGIGDLNPAVEKRIDSLLAIMTTEEKLGQLSQITAPWDDKTKRHFVSDALRDQLKGGRIGSFLNVVGAEVTCEFQRVAVEESRLGIPLIFGLDVIHGFRTIFPIPLGAASSWHPEAVERAARIAAIEATTQGIHWTFAPMVDIARDPRWGRIAEGFGEDPFLASVMSAASVRGFQGESFSDPSTIMACAKHFVAYGGAQAGRDYSTVDISERTLREVYLPPFKAAVDAGVGTLMSAFNEISSVPASANPYTLTTILRDEWGFKGFVVSDWTAVMELLHHGFASDSADAGVKALNAGVDMEMVSGFYINTLPGPVKEGTLSLEVLHESVRRVLRVKHALGLFETPYRNCDTTRAVKEILGPEFVAFSRKLAGESIVLLKNEGDVLPLRKDLMTLAVIGPLAEMKADLLGPWAGLGDGKDVVSVLDGVRATAGPGTTILSASGCDSTFADSTGFQEAATLARRADAVILVAGELRNMSGEAASRSNISLPGVQQQLVRRILATGKPVILVLINGRPLDLSWESQHVSAIVEAWFPGVQAGFAIADVLFGDVNPGGKLPVTFPRSVGQVPIHYDMKNSGRPFNHADKFTSKYLDIPNTPMYPFGYGLSYTTFEYSDLQVTPKKIHAGESVKVSVRIRNRGNRDGHEIVQLYIRDVVASFTRPVKQLKGFKRVHLKFGESQTVEFDLTPESLSLLDANWKPVIEPGEFKVFVGTNAMDTLEAKFNVE